MKIARSLGLILACCGTYSIASDNFESSMASAYIDKSANKADYSHITALQRFFASASILYNEIDSFRLEHSVIVKEMHKNTLRSPTACAMEYRVHKI
jgi:hypothetical protein